MKHIYIPKNTASNNQFSNFTFKKKTCLSCKTTMSNPGGILKLKLAMCPGCVGKTKQFYIERKIEANYYERLYNSLWTECQRCQGSLLLDVICQNRDCPIYYKRIKTKKELQESYEVLKRFSE